MTGIEQRIENLDAQIRNLQSERHKLAHIKDLWQKFGDIPMNPETECLEKDFIPRTTDGILMYRFPAGTHREDIWHWFEEEFNLSVAKDLMYG